MCDSQVSEKIAISSRYGTTKSSSPLSNSAMSLLKKYGAFFNPKLILRGLYVPKLVQKAAYRCAVLLKGLRTKLAYGIGLGHVRTAMASQREPFTYNLVMYLPLEVHPSKYQRELEV
ncbi:hypothetical protein TNCV_1303971 [Trichonephila clavipes]|nr:hypothetical protein TNCV_1303971 [Trichonephila clavipes]